MMKNVAAFVLVLAGFFAASEALSCKISNSLYILYVMCGVTIVSGILVFIRILTISNNRNDYECLNYDSLIMIFVL